MTGTYWKYTENEDSNIPDKFCNKVSEKIGQLLKDRSIYLPKFSDLVDNNKDLFISDSLTFYQKVGIFEKMFCRNKKLTSKYDSEKLIGEHVYVVISFLKSNGYKNIKSIPIKDVDCNSNKYVFEVEQVVINNISFFEMGDIFLESAEIIVTYHTKKEIIFPYALNYFKKKNYIIVSEQLKTMGFFNISERKINDLVTGWIIKNGSVEHILVKNGNEEKPISKNQIYEFDIEIVITYHTFQE